MSNPIRKILEEVNERQQKLREEAEESLKKFMEETGLTLFEMIVDYEVATSEAIYPKVTDALDLDANDYKLEMTFKTRMRKRTPEERQQFIESLLPMFTCACGHNQYVHVSQGSNIKCLEPACACRAFTFEKAKIVEEQVDFGGWEDH